LNHINNSGSGTVRATNRFAIAVGIFPGNCLCAAAVIGWNAEDTTDCACRCANSAADNRSDGTSRRTTFIGAAFGAANRTLGKADGGDRERKANDKDSMLK
jgi:hypothetical protein